MTDAVVTRIETLEVRIAYQDETIETLNATVTAQWTQIEALKREVARLGDRVQEAETRAAPVAQQEPPPPHY